MPEACTDSPLFPATALGPPRPGPAVPDCLYGSRLELVEGYGGPGSARPGKGRGEVPGGRRRPALARMVQKLLVERPRLVVREFEHLPVVQLDPHAASWRTCPLTRVLVAPGSRDRRRFLLALRSAIATFAGLGQTPKSAGAKR